MASHNLVNDIGAVKRVTVIAVFDGWSLLSIAMAANAASVVASMVHVDCLSTVLISLDRCECWVIREMLWWFQELSISVVTVIVNPVSEPVMVAVVLYRAWRVFWVYSSRMAPVGGDHMTVMRTEEIMKAATASAPMKCFLYHRYALAIRRPPLRFGWRPS